MEYTAADLRAVQDHFGFLRPEPVEKDWHVIQALAAITAMNATPFTLVFAGGTALARAHRLIRRMSEDVDFKIVPVVPVPASRSEHRTSLRALRDKVSAALQAAGFVFNVHDPAQVRSRNENQYTIYQLPYGEPGRAGETLRPTMQVEITYAPLRQPSLLLPVSSFIAEALGRPPEVPAIPCVSVTETAAEKLVALTRRTAMERAGLSRDPDPTLVRHIYDLHLMRAHLDHEATTDLARLIAIDDAEAFKNQYPAYKADMAGETHKALQALQSDAIFRERYASFVAAMVYGERPGFDEAMETIIDLVERL